MPVRIRRPATMGQGGRMTAHLLFEQSGTFKNAFKRLGVDAYDYDILNDFGETDYKIDLFQEIDRAYIGGGTIFDRINKDDIIIAFFPCTLFQENNFLMFKGNAYQQKNQTTEQKLAYTLERHNELNRMYGRISKLCLIAIRKGLRIIIENPYTQPHYLTLFFPIEPTIIDKNRRDRGDYYRKPTQYFFINCEPKNNFIFEPLEWVDIKNIEHQRNEDGKNRQVVKSMIHPQYAERFIKEFIL